MECNNDCICKKACNIVGCIYDHPLAERNNIFHFTEQGRPLTIKECLAVFNKLSPPKISDAQKSNALYREKCERLGIPVKEKKPKGRNKKVTDRLINAVWG